LAIGLNFILGLYLLHFFFLLDNFILSIIINLMVFIVPGAAWRGVWRSKVRNSVEEIILLLVTSSIFLLAGVLVHFSLGVEISAKSHFVYLATVTNLGLIFVKPPAKRNGITVLSLISLLIACLAYILFYWSALRVVPPIADHDMEVQGTAYGLMRRLRPYYVSDRGEYYFFAHPLLLHFYNGHTILFSDTLDDMKYYHQNVSKARIIKELRLKPGMEIIFSRRTLKEKLRRTFFKVDEKTAILNRPPPKSVGSVEFAPFGIGRFRVDKNLIGEGNTLDVAYLRRAALKGLVEKQQEPRFTKYYEKRPRRIIFSRMPSIFFAALAAWVLFRILNRITGSVPLSILGVVMYCTFLDVLIRSATSAYTAISCFLMLTMAYLYIFPSRKNEGHRTFNLPLLLCGVLAGLANHKMVILPLAILLTETIFRLHPEITRQFSRWARSKTRALPSTKSARQKIKGLMKGLITQKAVWGFLVGTAAFWIYGLCVAPDVFITEHLKYHLWNRIVHSNVLGYTHYPSVFLLWKEFVQNMGIFFPLVAVPATLYSLREIRERKFFFAIWFLVGAVIYSVVDWRQIQHLMLIVPPMVLGIFHFYQKSGKITKIFILALLLFSLLVNLVLLWQLTLDFHQFEPTGGW